MEIPLPILENCSETARKYLGQSAGGEDGIQHLYHQPRHPRGVGDNHDGPTGERLSSGGITGFHDTDSWVETNFMSRAVRKTKVETIEWRLNLLLPCFRLYPYFQVYNFRLFRFLSV